MLGAHVTVPCGANTNLLTRATLSRHDTGDYWKWKWKVGSLVVSCPCFAELFDFFSFVLIGKKNYILPKQLRPNPNPKYSDSHNECD